MTLVLGLLSDGAYHDDDLTHFLMARWVRWRPEYLLHFWGRPGFTLPMALVAWIGDPSVGWHAARMLSAVVTALAALVAARLAGSLGIRSAWLVVLACYVQPYNTLLACTTLTETFAALYLVAALALLHHGRPILASLVFSLILVTRHEAMTLWPLWVIAVLSMPSPTARRAAAAVASISALLLHNLLFRIFLSQWPAAMFFQPHGSTEFTPAGVLAYVPQALLAVPPVVAGLAIVGAIRLLRRGNWLIPALTAAFVLTHAASKAFGLFASGGYARFMVSVCPLVAVLTAAGLTELIDSVRYRRGTTWIWLIQAGVWLFGLAAVEIEYAAGRLALPFPLSMTVLRVSAAICVSVIAMGWAATAARPNTPSRLRSRLGVTVLLLLVLTCILQVGPFIKPLKPSDGAKRVQSALSWLKTTGLDHEPIFTTHPWVAYFEDWVELPWVHKGPTLLASMPVGTIVIWDSIYSPNDFHRLPLAALDHNPAYEKLGFWPGVGTRPVEFQLFRKIATTAPPVEPEICYPLDLMARGRPASGRYYIRPGP